MKKQFGTDQSHLVFRKSLTYTCSGFTTSTKFPATIDSICISCKKAQWTHALSTSSIVKNSRELAVMMDVFCAIRNARIVASPIGLSSSNPVVSEYIIKILHISGSLRSMKLEGMYQVLELMEDIQRVNGESWRIR
jgi:hypothetical protein